MNSQLQIRTNLMLDDRKHMPEHLYMPGDLVGEIFKEFVNPESMHRTLTPQQQVEYLRYLPCLLCGRSCAGTCGKKPEGVL